MKQLIILAIVALVTETTFGHGEIISWSTDGEGKFEYVVGSGSLAYSLDHVVLPFGFGNSGVYSTEGPENWSVTIGVDETVFVADIPDAALPPMGQETFVIYSNYIYSAYIKYPIYQIGRDGRERIIGYQDILGPAAQPHFVDANIDLDPDTLNLKGKHKWITAYIESPEGYTVEDMETSTVILKKDDFEVMAESGEIDEGLLKIKFPCEQLKCVLEAGLVELTIRGKFSDGTFFEGIDTIMVIDKDAEV